MDIRSVLLVAVSMAIPAACLVYGWWKTSDASHVQSWRNRLSKIGLLFASLSLLLTSAFLIRGWHWAEQSFGDRPPLYWLALNWFNVISWLFVCFTVVLGAGKLRKVLLIWCVSQPLLAYFALMMSYTY